MNQCSKTFTALIAVILIAAATAVTAPAAPPAKLSPASESAETRFVLYALEDLLRDTWPDPKSVGDGRAVKTFIAQRERIVDDLSHRVRDQKLGGDRNAELIEALELYMKSVREHGNKYAAELDKIIDAEGITKKWLAIHKQTDKGADPARNLVAAQISGAALDYLRKPDSDPIGGIFLTLVLGMGAEAQIQSEVKAKAWSEFANGPLRQAREEYAKKQPELAKKLVDEMRLDLEKRRKVAGELATALGAPRKWGTNDTPFAASDKPGDRTSDPFAQLRIEHTKAVATDKGPTREAAERFAKAQSYMKLAELIPRPADKAYNFYRSVIYYQAGREANWAAALSVGSNGFSDRKGSDASRLALSVWQLYSSNNDRDLSPEVLHNYALALAYNGRSIEAYHELKKAPPQYLPRSADFCYDLARLCSIAAEDQPGEFAKFTMTPAFMRLNFAERKVAAKNAEQMRNEMLQQSSRALQGAIFCGFKDVAKAQQSPDLQALRDATSPVLGRYRTYEQIVNDRKTFEKTIESIIAQKTDHSNIPATTGTKSGSAVTPAAPSQKIPPFVVENLRALREHRPKYIAEVPGLSDQIDAIAAAARANKPSDYQTALVSALKTVTDDKREGPGVTKVRADVLTVLTAIQSGKSDLSTVPIHRKILREETGSEPELRGLPGVNYPAKGGK